MLFYRFIRILFRIVALPMFRFRVRGLERVPRSGPVIVVAAHRSWLDPPCVGGAMPRPVRFLMINTVYHKRWASWFYRLMGAMPVSRGGTDSVIALRSALRMLKKGKVVGVFPEGRVITGEELGEVHPGAAMLACRTGAPVLPVLIRGSARAWPHGRKWPGPAPVSVHFGDPIPVERDGRREAVSLLLARIENALTGLGSEVSEG